MPNYEFNGQLYSKASNHQAEWGSRVIDGLGVKADSRILDLGCGDGRLTHALALRAEKGRVTGIDASLGMLEKAREHSTPNLEFLHMDINDINFENEFDIIFSNAALHWVHGHKKLLDNCFRALRPGGAIRFNFAGKGNCRALFSVVRALMRKKEYAPHFAGFVWPWYMPAVDEYENLMDRTDFINRKVWGQIADRYFKSAVEITGWIDQPSLVPFLKEIADPEARRTFRDEAVGMMLEGTRQADGTYFETFFRINVRGGKG